MISPPIVLATSEARVFFWVLVITFWVVSSLIQKSREKKELEKKRAAARERQNAPSEPAREVRDEPRPQPASRPEDELRRFLEEITGRVPREETPPPAEGEDEREPPPPPIVVRRQIPVPKSSRRPAQPAIVLDEPAPVRPAPPIPLGAYERIGEIEDIEVLMSRQAAILYSGEGVVNPDGLLFNLSRIRVPLMPMPLVSLRSNRNTHADRPPITSNAKALREALITRTLLSPCKALEGIERE